MNLLGIFQSKGDKFYRWFEEVAENNYKAAQLLEKLCKNFKDPKKVSAEIHELEHYCDQITHDLFHEINRVFVTPLDREDIIMLATNLDDVIDLIFAASSTIDTHNVKKMTPAAYDFSKIITASTKLVSETLPKLRHRKNFARVQKAAIEINRLENEADALLRKSLSELFHKPKDPLDVIKWKDIYEIMEDITDKTEDIANVLQNLIIKYA